MNLFASEMVFPITKIRCQWLLHLLCTLISLTTCLGFESDTILSGQSLFPNQTIISKEGKFELGFFSPGNSSDLNSRNYYVGIWYKKIQIQTVVWVANRNNPVPYDYYNSSRFELSNGNLYLSFNSEAVEIARNINATEGVILDTGNFVLRNGSGNLWQSFDNPTDTWLPGGKVGFNSLSDSNSSQAKLIPWRNSTDPAQGTYSLEIDPNGGAELFMMGSGKTKYWRSGAWQGGSFALFPGNFYNFTYVSTDGRMYFTYNEFNETLMSRIVIEFYGTLSLRVWSELKLTWVTYLQLPSSLCNSYNFCGMNAFCNEQNAPPCTCLTGFMPQRKQDWYFNDFSGGCGRRNPLQCYKGNAEFHKYTINLPANPQSLAVGTSDICEFACSVNCSCNAYSFSIKRVCLLFFGDLLDMKRAPVNTTGTDLYIKMESVKPPGKGIRKYMNLVFAMSAVTAMLMGGAFIFFLQRRFKRNSYQRRYQNLLLLDLNSTRPASNQHTAVETHRGEEESEDYELPIFSFSSIVSATDNFSVRNKLGEGGFGPVYKGELVNGQFVAVKRLSRMSGQGLEEFKNETELIAKLQHRNLVRIFGCCVQEDEKILIYEYMPNRSLDCFLFEPAKKESLDWSSRVHIIEGIAQGLLYLHQYTRLRIVHRDLKASNILLDGDMNPKISDFGMARIFGGNDSQANTKRIVGTFGYMSPEYAMGGIFSIKSDVFAFGVLLLEIISGKKNTSFYSSASLSLLRHAWNLWQNNRGLELVDPVLEVSSSSRVPLIYIHVGLLCVQESPVDRPTMLDVVSMLNYEQTSLAAPQQPAFTVGRTCFIAKPGENKVEIPSVNDMTVSLMEPR